VPNVSPQKEWCQLKKATQNLSLLTSLPLCNPLKIQNLDIIEEKTLIKKAVDAAYLPLEGKLRLLQILEGCPQLCTLLDVLRTY